ncbi:hypothetical protein [Segatella hominis]|uniref:hypothetical protein n=1 Tax=Segatella hominis TaxID=2518605 RepID=UPI0021C6E124|nr:hypothetical protein [Segatella hominis]
MMKAKFDLGITKANWPTPKLYGVGNFTEFGLYQVALTIAKINGYINQEVLMSEIPQRIKGLIVVDSISSTSYEYLIRELLHFQFIDKTSDKTEKYVITSSGKNYLSLCSTNEGAALNYLLEKMQDVFITPAWFVKRLWELNKIGQGQIVIPLPLREWHPKSRVWTENNWDDEIEMISRDTAILIQKKIPGAFPYNVDEWLDALKKEYVRLGSQKPKSNISDMKDEDVHFSVRNRLSLAMKTVAVRKFFSRLNPQSGNLDFPNKRSEMTHRSFMVWCPRLAAFDMIFYTDNNPEIPGRLLFPVSVFKHESQNSSYIEKKFVKDPYGACLYIHSPKWEDFEKIFIETLVEVYQKYYNKQTIIYISLQDIRDEVCRLLRISPHTFELFLQKTYELSILHKIRYSISLETDLRLDMKIQINRRGVYLNGILYSLIALKPLEK